MTQIHADIEQNDRDNEVKRDSLRYYGFLQFFLTAMILDSTENMSIPSFFSIFPLVYISSPSKVNPLII